MGQNLAMNVKIEVNVEILGWREKIIYNKNIKLMVLNMETNVNSLCADYISEEKNQLK